MLSQAKCRSSKVAVLLTIHLWASALPWDVLLGTRASAVPEERGSLPPSPLGMPIQVARGHHATLPQATTRVGVCSDEIGGQNHTCKNIWRWQTTQC
eukprot:scaffold8047_cov417-Prasinococcus_capsulatus_cf.AAC.5